MGIINIWIYTMMHRYFNLNHVSVSDTLKYFIHILEYFIDTCQWSI